VARVPLLDLRAQFLPIREEILSAIARVCDSQRFILGPEVDALERELAEHLEVPEAVTVSSGTDALLAAMMALGIGPGDEVVTTTYSFFATAGCISRLGAAPRFVDIDPVTEVGVALIAVLVRRHRNRERHPASKIRIVMEAGEVQWLKIPYAACRWTRIRLRFKPITKARRFIFAARNVKRFSKLILSRTLAMRPEHDC